MLRATSTVLGFVLGAVPGPRRMIVQGQGLPTFDIRGIEELFPLSTEIYSTHVRVGMCTFKVYYDKQRHVENREEAVYVFVGLASSGRAVNICPEDDLPFMMQALTQYVVILNIGRRMQLTCLGGWIKRRALIEVWRGS
ncbi:hypothetical protein BKA83DRAFT_2307042 [Pisolithus microcarpus]|nr:hypothetical protein BKA83DRAFT_3610963 [Pisolithus microcarpus]KAI6031677.1 hypothetical protein BKA83DRAFT_2307042 [Pisolithus microcarpus]